MKNLFYSSLASNKGQYKMTNYTVHGYNEWTRHKWCRNCIAIEKNDTVVDGSKSSTVLVLELLAT